MEIYEVKLNNIDLKIISENLNNGLLKARFSKIVENFELSQSQTISFDEQEVEEIEDCLLNLFCERGLFETDEPNDFGYYIENLIDKFSME